MSKLVFHSNEKPTVGVEIELGLVDAETMELSSSIKALLERLPPDAAKCYKPELMQSCIEINSGVCHTIDEVEQDLRSKITVVEQAADALALRL